MTTFCPGYWEIEIKQSSVGVDLWTSGISNFMEEIMELRWGKQTSDVLLWKVYCKMNPWTLTQPRMRNLFALLGKQPQEITLLYCWGLPWPWQSARGIKPFDALLGKILWYSVGERYHSKLCWGKEIEVVSCLEWPLFPMYKLINEDKNQHLQTKECTHVSLGICGLNSPPRNTQHSKQF